MKLLLPTHHSTPDWDYDGPLWELSAAQFVSPPTSFTPTSSTGIRALLRIPAAQCLPEGRLRGYFRLAGSALWGFYFRTQTPLGTWPISATYRVTIRAVGNAEVGCWKDGGWVWGGDWSWTAPDRAWCRIQLTWEMTVDEEENPALAVKFEVEVDGEWVDYGTKLHTNPPWTDSPINRIGLLCVAWGSYCDDIELERPG